MKSDKSRVHSQEGQAKRYNSGSKSQVSQVENEKLRVACPDWHVKSDISRVAHQEGHFKSDESRVITQKWHVESD